MARGINRPKVEWSEIHRIVCLRIDHPECDLKEAALNRLAASQQINLETLFAKS
jgi:hypothetical protein